MKEYVTSTYTLIRIDDAETFAALVDAAKPELVTQGRRLEVHASTGRHYTTLYIQSQDPQFVVLVTPNENLESILVQLRTENLDEFFLPLRSTLTREQYDMSMTPLIIDKDKPIRWHQSIN